MSVYYDLLTGVKTSINGVTAISASIRDDLYLLEGESVPLIIIAPDVENIRLQAWPKNIVYDYKINIAYIIAGNHSVNSDLSGYLTNRQLIRNQLYQLPAPATAWDVKIEPQAVSKFAALLGTNYRVTGWQMTYSVCELRSGS